MAFSEEVTDWLCAGVDWLVKSCDLVEKWVEKITSPIVEELRALNSDVAAFQNEVPPSLADSDSPPADGSLSQAFAVLRGDTWREHFQDLENDGNAAQSHEEQQARNQLAMGGITLAAGIAGSLFIPALIPLAVGGIIYQVFSTFRDTYRSLVKKFQFNINVYRSVTLIAAMLSGSIVALALAVALNSFLRWITLKTEYMARQSVTAVFANHPRMVWLWVNESEVQVPFEQVEVGDTLIISPGEMIPVDGVVVQGSASIDQRMLTGESQLVDKGIGEEVLASTLVLRGRLHVRVARSGQDTVTAQIARTLADTSTYKREIRSRIELQVERLLFPYAILGLVTWPLQGLDPALAVAWAIPTYRMLMFSPLTMLTFMHIAARQGILLKSGRSIETLREVDTVVFDKTGTLTLEQPRVGHIFCFTGVAPDEVLQLAVTAEHGQTHPIAVAIQQLAKTRAIAPLPGDGIELAVGFGVIMSIAGQRILLGSERLMRSSNVAMPDEACRQQAEVHQRGHSLIFLARGLELLGALEICPTLRPEAGQVIRELQRRGMQVCILSGDHEAPTRALAEQLGIQQFFAQILPADKASAIHRLQAEGRKVCYVGDGINDALALEKADVSVSLKGATAVATTVAQVVLMRSNLEQLIQLFDLSEQFESRMRSNRLLTRIPSFVVLGGAMAFGWGFLASILIGNMTMPIAYYNSLLGPVTTLPPAAADDPAPSTHES